MATFQVPQFIEQKPRIVGPLTLKQFGFLAAAGITAYIAFNVFNVVLATVIAIPVGVAGVALAFLKIHGQELPRMVYAGFKFFWRPRTYLWQREMPQAVFDASSLRKIEALRSHVGLQEKLRALALAVATGRGRGEAHIRGGQERGFQTVQHLTGERERARRVDYKT